MHRPRKIINVQQRPTKQDVKADLKIAKSRTSPYRREYVLPDGVTNLRGYVKPTPAEQEAAAAATAATGDGKQQAGGGGGGGAAAAGQGGGGQPQQQQQQQAAKQPKPNAGDQVLVLNNELFMVPEVLFRCGPVSHTLFSRCGGETRAGTATGRIQHPTNQPPPTNQPTNRSQPTARPTDIGLQQAGLPEAVAQAVAACHPALAPLLWSNVILTGGCCRLPGLSDRFARELRTLAPDEFEVGVVAPQVGGWLRGWVGWVVCADGQVLAGSDRRQILRRWSCRCTM